MYMEEWTSILTIGYEMGHTLHNRTRYYRIADTNTYKHKDDRMKSNGDKQKQSVVLNMEMDLVC